MLVTESLPLSPDQSITRLAPDCSMIGAVHGCMGACSSQSSRVSLHGLDGINCCNIGDDYIH